MVPNWPEYFLGIANQVKLKSKDKNTNIGAVIVGTDNQIVSTGYNSFPRGINDDVPERQSRENGEKYFWFEHAERNAIYNAALHGSSTKGCTMYLTCWIPCSDCARAIIQAGITTVYCTNDMAAQRQKWSKSGERSLQMFNEAGVDVRYYE